MSRRFCEEFCQDMETLNCLPPSEQPKVSDHMPQIIDMIEKVSLLSVLLLDQMKHEKINKFNTLVLYSIYTKAYMDILLVYEMLLFIVYY